MIEKLFIDIIIKIIILPILWVIKKMFKSTARKLQDRWIPLDKAQIISRLEAVKISSINQLHNKKIEVIYGLANYSYYPIQLNSISYEFEINGIKILSADKVIIEKILPKETLRIEFEHTLTSYEYEQIKDSESDILNRLCLLKVNHNIINQHDEPDFIDITIVPRVYIDNRIE